MNIEEIANEHTREIIKNIFNKLDDEEKYIILELNNQLQDKINKIDKAIELIKICEKNIDTPDEDIVIRKVLKNILEILGEKDV